jgi:hypothetical protein
MDVEQQGRRQPLAPDQGGHSDGGEPWSPRSRRLIDETQVLCESWLEAPVRACLLEAGHKLLGLADQARNHMDQQLHMNMRQQLQNQREALERHFLAAVAQRFVRLGQKSGSDAPAALALLDVDEHEETAALEQAGARSEARHAPLLFELSYRFAALASLPPLEGEDLPLGAQALAHAFLDSLRDHDIAIRHRLLLLDSFDHTVVRHLASLYETVNQHLASEGILPFLHAYRIARPGDERRPRAPASIEGPAAASLAATPPPAGDGVLDTLRALLTLHRGHVAVGPAHARVASDEQLQQALASLQEHLAGTFRRVADGSQDAQRLRAELLAHLNAVPDAKGARLSEEQEDTVQLVALLFEQMTTAVQRNSHAQRLLGELELPLLRLALADRGVFEQGEHPARRLLSAMADTAGEWLDSGDADTDRSIALKLTQLVEQARREPPSATLYTQLLTDIEQHVSLLARKAQVAERRQVEAMQGRERLEHARSRAAQLMAERFQAAPPRGLLRTLLERAWSDVLALTLLRNGEESDTFIGRLRITDQLLGLAAIDDRTRLLMDIQTGLQQIGMQAEEAAQVAQRLLGTPAPDEASAVDAGLSATGAALKLKQHQRLGEQAAAAATVTPPVQLPEPLSGDEQRIHARLLGLPFGTWFEFADASGPRTSMQKLAWYSSVSGRCLFVTRRGTRGEELTLEQLARDIARGRARETAGERESFFDRALHALFGRLRHEATLPARSRP